MVRVRPDQPRPIEKGLPPPPSDSLRQWWARLRAKWGGPTVQSDIDRIVKHVARDGAFLDAVAREIARARGKFPTNRHRHAALVEEVGELTKALLEHHYGNVGAEQIYWEAVQVAAMAARLAIEGDPDFDYESLDQYGTDD